MSKYRCIKCRSFKSILEFSHKEGNIHRNRKCNDCVVEPEPKNLLKGQARIDADSETKLFNQFNGAW